MTRTPLLIVHGERDRRVPMADTLSYVSAVRAAGGEVELLTFPDEGHGIRQQDNQLRFISVAENFLARCLGSGTPTNGVEPAAHEGARC
jgi:dipeptidyl aminopeptidase/acylaminoacyl peptidase